VRRFIARVFELDEVQAFLTMRLKYVQILAADESVAELASIHRLL
jgi:hypothetical protein